MQGADGWQLGAQIRKHHCCRTQSMRATLVQTGVARGHAQFSQPRDRSGHILKLIQQQVRPLRDERGHVRLRQKLLELHLCVRQ